MKFPSVFSNYLFCCFIIILFPLPTKLESPKKTKNCEGKIIYYVCKNVKYKQYIVYII